MSCTAGPVRALASNDIQFFWTPITTVKSVLDTGAGVGLAVTSQARQALAPDIPTTAEQGMNVKYYVTNGLFGPQKTPKDVVDILYRASNDVTSSAEGKAILAKFGYESVTADPAEISRQINAQSRRYAEIAAAIGLKPQ